MNNTQKLKLKEFIKFYLAYKNTITTSPRFSFSIYGLIKTVLNYYEYALASFELYSSSFSDFLNDKELGAGTSIKDKMTTSVFGIYTNGNVCLQITKKLNEYIREFSGDEKLNNLLKDVSKNKDIVKWNDAFRKKRNLIVVHPTQNQNNTGNCDCFPDKCARLTGWGSGGFSFDIYSMLTGDTHSEYQILPYDEIKQLREYLESLAPIYAEFFLK